MVHNVLGVQLLRAAAGFDPAANPPPGGWAGLQATLQQILGELEEGRELQQQQQAALVQMQATLQQVLAAQQQQQATLAQQQATLVQQQTALTQLLAAQQRMQARQDNEWRRRENRMAQQAPARHGIALVPLGKERPAAAGAADAAGGAAPGALPPADIFFPQTWGAIQNVSARAVLRGLRGAS